LKADEIFHKALCVIDKPKMEGGHKHKKNAKEIRSDLEKLSCYALSRQGVEDLR